jgi:hypothetical protein
MHLLYRVWRQEETAIEQLARLAGALSSIPGLSDFSSLISKPGAATAGPGGVGGASGRLRASGARPATAGDGVGVRATGSLNASGLPVMQSGLDCEMREEADGTLSVSIALETLGVGVRASDVELHVVGSHELSLLLPGGVDKRLQLPVGYNADTVQAAYRRRTARLVLTVERSRE